MRNNLDPKIITVDYTIKRTRKKSPLTHKHIVGKTLSPIVICSMTTSLQHTHDVYYEMCRRYVSKIELCVRTHFPDDHMTWYIVGHYVYGLHSTPKAKMDRRRDNVYYYHDGNILNKIRI